jgi:SAM-dependent methyltransferase
MADSTPLYTRLAAAYVRGRLIGSAAAAAQPALFGPALDALAPEELQALLALGAAEGLRLHRFKRTMGLPRVMRVLGILRGVAPAELLDIGSGRGVFLWPLLDGMPHLPVTAIDTLDHRVEGLCAVAEGGVPNLHAQRADATRLPFADREFDAITLLEVLEHIPNTAAALAEVLRVARRFVILSVPSQPDNNPEHIHLFGAGRLEALLLRHGAARVSFEHVPGHLIAIARVA